MISLGTLWSAWLSVVLTSSILLAVGAVAVALTRAPVQKIRLVVLTLLSGLIAPVVGALPGVPRWSTRIWVAPAGSQRVEVPKARPILEPPAKWTATAPAAGDEPPSPADAVSRPVLQPPLTTAATADIEQTRMGTALDLRPVVLSAWVIGAVGWLCWWWVGQIVLGRIARSARSAPETVRRQFLEIAGMAGSDVRLLATDRVVVPFTFTWLRPTILLPEHLTLPELRAELSFALGHEWSHVERDDYHSWMLVSLGATFWFWHPCYWILRRQLRLSQDYLADDSAARTGPPVEFAAYLVRLARTRLDHARFPLPALGISGRCSPLSRRITMLLADRPPHTTCCRPVWTGMVTMLAALAVLFAASVHLDAAPRPEPASPSPVPGQLSNQSAEVPRDVLYLQRNEPKRQAPEGLVIQRPQEREWLGKVVDQVTGQPVDRAEVRVKISTSHDLKTNEWRDIRDIRTTTPADGSYRFTLTPEEQLDDSLYITLYVDHPDHVQWAAGYAYRMLLKNIDLGERPFFEKLELYPARAVEGLVLTPDGAPAAGVKIQAYSERDVPREGHEFGQFSKTQTDDRGRFRLPLHVQGKAVFWLLPEQFEPSCHPLKDNRRGDLGTFTLARGVRIQGRVLDVAGRPVGGIYVGASRSQQGNNGDDGIPLGVADAIQRSAVTLGDGTFTLPPMPPGPVEVRPTESDWDPTARDLATGPSDHPLPAVFLPEQIKLVAGQDPAPVVIQAVSQVQVTAQLTNSKGEKKGGYATWLRGKFRGQWWSSQFKPSQDGFYAMIAPQGLTDAQFDLRNNEHSTTMYRLAKDAPLRRGRDVPLGTLDHDVTGIELIRFQAPVILIRATSPNGHLVPNCQVSVNLVGRDPKRGGFILKGGGRSEISLEGPQEDGRFRTTQLPPDTDVEVKVTAPGYAPASRQVRLPEGKTEEIAFVLERQ